MIDDGKPITHRQDSSSSTASSSSSGLLRFRRTPDSETMTSIQVAIKQTVSSVDLKPSRDLLIEDFMNFESLIFQTKTDEEAGATTNGTEFKFYDYAPVAFKYFRGLFNIKTKDFIRSMCSERLKQLETSGSSGSIFYVTHDDSFILKTAQQRESDFLLKLLPGYYLNLTQNPKTLLPKFFGFYNYSGGNKNIRILVMNNLIPTNAIIHQKYDLKGSTNKRRATQSELKKTFPTYKDLDFIEHYPEGLLLDRDTYVEFSEALQRDCRVLESFKIIDYSLLLAVYYMDRNELNSAELATGIPAKTPSGEPLLLFVGIIDILQSYQFRKKLEHTLKSIFYEKNSISVHRPDFYSQRFQDFILQTVFQPATKKISVTRSKLKSEPCTSSIKLKLEHRQLSLSWTSSCVKFSNKKSSHSLSDDDDDDDDRVNDGSEKNKINRILNVCDKIDEEVKNENLQKTLVGDGEEKKPLENINENISSLDTNYK